MIIINTPKQVNNYLYSLYLKQEQEYDLLNKGSASFTILTFTGYCPTVDDITSDEADKIHTIFDNYTDIHKDRELFTYQLLHVVNIIRKRNNLKTFDLTDIAEKMSEHLQP